MDISYELMHGIVMRYCNQNYLPYEEPPSLTAVIEAMCDYTAKSMNSNKASETIATYSYTLDEKDLFQKFAGLLSPYKRLKTV